MKKFIFLFLTAAFVFSLSSCQEQKVQKAKKNMPKKERHESSY